MGPKLSDNLGMTKDEIRMTNQGKHRTLCEGGLTANHANHANGEKGK